MDSFAERLKFFRSKRNMSQSDLAEAIGKSRKIISDYENGKIEPRDSTLMSILNALNVDFNTFYFSTPEDYLKDILYRDSVETVTFTNDKHALVLPSKRLTSSGYNSMYMILADVNGDSMSPTLNSNDLALVYTFDKTTTDGELYYIDFFGENLFARVYRESKGEYTLSRDNKAYRDKSISEEDLKIIGKVIFRQGFL